MKQIPIIGFISPPTWFDPSPAEFSKIVLQEVQTQQTILPLLDFDYQIGSFASLQMDLNMAAQLLKASGCNLIVQVGSPFAWAGTKNEEEARQRCESMSTTAGVPVIMNTLAIIDALRAINVRNIAVNCTYYKPEWRDRFGDFLSMCGFNPLYLSNLADQNLVEPDNIFSLGWAMTSQLTINSTLAVAKAVPEAEAIVVTGAGARTLDILNEMETHVKRPIIAADTILYWAVARELNLTMMVEMLINNLSPTIKSEPLTSSL